MYVCILNVQSYGEGINMCSTFERPIIQTKIKSEANSLVLNMISISSVNYKFSLSNYKTYLKKI